MKIGNDEIITPCDDKIGYALDWRSRIVDAVIATGGDKLPKEFKRDTAMASLLACMQGTSKPDAYCLDAISIKASPMMSRVVEAFLLTRSTIAQICEETGLSGVSFYELLYFNVRNRSGDPLQSQILRLGLELEASKEPSTPTERIDRALKRAAIDGDVQLLRSYLPQRRTGISTGSFAGTLVQRELMRRLLRGELSTGILVKLRGLEIAEDRMTLSLNRSGNQALHSDGDYYVGDMDALRYRL